MVVPSGARGSAPESSQEVVPSGARRTPRRDDAAASPDGGTAPGSGAVRQDGNVTATPVPRRLFLARGLAVTAGAVALGTAGTEAYFANSAPVVRRVPVTLAELREDVAPLADLVSQQGVYFVTGNHEYFVDTTAWLRHLPTLGIDVLRNERVAIGRGAATFDLAGIDDRTAASSGLPGHGADLDTALDGRDDGVPVVLLAHQPAQVEQARAAGVDLQLSGHTHGGQLWPFDYAIRLDQPAVEGLSRHGETQLYVTTGAGYWGPPMRVGARPEVAVIELRSPPR